MGNACDCSKNINSIYQEVELLFNEEEENHTDA